ncbi:hypothetical protein GobsT_63400 [Gemmata obscuriglobus]|uniref:Uncharacterized protein n=1 Tax=Gemmata obscuriglobus TaxID=114 RepID=A0A2Z3GWZ7_9BACT|nr:hypothetical protein [Gemmata obscuriglobus]AWM35926.1 hypothetical protein C1280_02125 [Gemmata obscuriglobus]QEG31518.1 hypothetical protein GobsT_63400 [Gemmata obscuriglobus]VTS10860.1 unnamed protein product [Gemmata obscuriglobus UQM 2246]
MRNLIRFAAVAVVAGLFAGDVLAGPILDRLRERRAARQGVCGACPSAEPARLSAAVPPCGACPDGSCPDGSCPGGVCPVPPAPGLDVSASPHPTAALPAGALVSVSGRVLLPNGDGTYRHADPGAPTVLPGYSLAPGCPNGRCPLPQQRLVIPVK